MELYFGRPTALLICATSVTFPIAIALPQIARNRTANRTLASPLIVLAVVIVPWMIGFAGFYDRWRWHLSAFIEFPIGKPSVADQVDLRMAGGCHRQAMPIWETFSL
jgi:hypothetical protein